MQRLQSRLGSLVVQAAFGAAALTFTLAALRLTIRADLSAPFVVLAAASLGFLATAIAARLRYLLFARWLLPTIGLATSGLLALSTGGLASEALVWMPFVPLVAVLLLGPREALVFALAAVVMVSGLAMGHVLESASFESIDTATLVLEYGSLTGALAFATGLGLAYERGRRLSTQNLQRAHGRLQAVVTNLSAGVAITDDKARIVSINQRLCDIFGVDEDPGDLIGRNAWRVITSGSRALESPAEFKEQIVKVVGAGVAAVDEVRMADGSVYSRDMVPLDLGGKTRGYLWTFNDITTHKEREERLLEHVQTDALTRLRSRTYFLSAVDKACRDDARTAVLFLDLDGFKEINDEHGHEAGDRVLFGVADRIRESIRRGDVAARFGGDEFAVLLSGASELAHATRVAELLLEAISRPLTVGERALRVGVSIGIILRDHEQSSRELLRAADAAMYEAKRAGKGSYRVAQKGSYKQSAEMKVKESASSAE